MKSMSTSFEPTPPATATRFLGRVEDYAKYRPPYPEALFAFLRAELSLTEEDCIADIGSGTGIFTEPLLRLGNTVYGVEPNPEMRQKAESLLQAYPKFHSMNGTAEATNLPDRSIDVITCAQAFHWCDPVKARREFIRIGTEDATTVLIWNKRDMTKQPFAIAFEAFIQKYAIDYAQIFHNKPGKWASNEQFFGKDPYCKQEFPNEEHLDFTSLKGRVHSLSYMPGKTHPGYPVMNEALTQLFADYHKDGYVTLPYVTEMFYGRLRR